MKISKLLHIIDVLIFVTLLLLVVDGMLPQAQLFIFKELLFPNYVLRLPLILLLLLKIFLNYKLGLKFDGMLAFGIILYCSFVSFYVLYGFMFLESSFVEIIFALNSYYFWSGAILLILASRLSINGELGIRYLNIFAILLCILGVFQSITGNEIVFQRSPDDAFYVSAIWFFGRLRAFSLFTSGYAFGQFLIMLILLNINRSMKGGWTYSSIGITALYCITIYFTYTRAIYLSLALSIILFFVAKNFDVLRSRIVVPLMCFLAGLIVVYAAGSKDEILNTRSSVLSSATSDERLSNWSINFNNWYNEIPTLLFGDGTTQNVRLDIIGKVTIDNSYIAILVNSGILGLMLSLILYFFLMQSIFKKAYRFTNVGPIIFFSLWMFYSMFNNAHTNYYAFVAIVFALISYREKNKNEQK